MLDQIDLGTLRAQRAQSMRAVLTERGYPSDWTWAWDQYKPVILALSDRLGLRRHFEVGGGRDCLFSEAETVAHDIEMTVNDISPRELALAPAYARKVLCDIAAPDAPETIGREAYDLVYCRMVMEHVQDVGRMWRNIGAILAPGGVALSFFPTLYAPPFAINRVIPEAVSRLILHTVFPHRRDDGDNPKFPAYYDLCRSNPKVLGPVLAEAGFSHVEILPFWGYSYFDKFPGLRQADAAFNRFARARDWRLFSSFAYVLAVK